MRQAARSGDRAVTSGLLAGLLMQLSAGRALDARAAAAVLAPRYAPLPAASAGEADAGPPGAPR